MSAATSGASGAGLAAGADTASDTGLDTGSDEATVDPGEELDASDVQPIITVAKGSPDQAELAALTAVVMALVSAQPEEESASRHAPRHWVRRAQLHVAPRPGPGAWRRSA